MEVSLRNAHPGDARRSTPSAAARARLRVARVRPRVRQASVFRALIG
jgi:hypothetical protein